MALNNAIDTNASYLSEAQSRHFEKWGNLGVSTGTPEMEADPATFEGQITKFKNWINLRLTWLDANIPGDANSCNLGTNTAFSKRNYSLYPNPVSDKLYFSSPTFLPESIEMFDASGKSIYKTTKFTSDTTINVASMANGIYYCKMLDGNAQNHIQKIVIMH
jgi:hypothetical protein